MSIADHSLTIDQQELRTWSGLTAWTIKRVAGGPVMPVPGQQPDADRQGIASGHQPIAVMLDLMHPVRPGWRSLARRWQAGFDNGRQGHFVTMP